MMYNLREDHKRTIEDLKKMHRQRIQSVKYDPEYRRLCEEIGRLMHQADPAKWEQLAQDIGREK